MTIEADSLASLVVRGNCAANLYLTNGVENLEIDDTADLYLASDYDVGLAHLGSLRVGGNLYGALRATAPTERFDVGGNLEALVTFFDHLNSSDAVVRIGGSKGNRLWVMTS